MKQQKIIENVTISYINSEQKFEELEELVVPTLQKDSVSVSDGGDDEVDDVDVDDEDDGVFFFGFFH